ncbi:MAG: hypothetical protein HFG22_18130 [Lachnospiraceae bacterium]|nr:hypothetical protein [Lachnospiraceae bacterium]
MEIAAIVLPVIFMLVLGTFLRAKKMIGGECVAGIKNVIANIMLPAVVFNALAMVSFTGDDIKLVAGIYVVFALLLAVVLMFCLPGQFITPIYVSDQEQRKFVSTQLSIYTLITILAYVLIAVFL